MGSQSDWSLGVIDRGVFSETIGGNAVNMELPHVQLDAAHVWCILRSAFSPPMADATLEKRCERRAMLAAGLPLDDLGLTRF